MSYSWDFTQIFASAPIWIDGAIGTLRLTSTALSLAIPLGLILAILRISGIWIVSRAAGWYINIARSTPALVLIFWFFFALPLIIDVQMNELTAATLALGLQGAAFFAEVFRSGIQSVHAGQWEAGKALALTNRQIFTYLILPQAVRNSLPVLITMTIELMKGTALAGSVGFPELAYRASEIANTTYRPLEAYTVLAIIFLVVMAALSQCGRMLERRLGRGYTRESV